MKCPNCGKEMEDGFMSITGYGIRGDMPVAKWHLEKTRFATGGSSLRLSGTLRGILWLEGARCRPCRTLVLSYFQ